MTSTINWSSKSQVVFVSPQHVGPSGYIIHKALQVSSIAEADMACERARWLRLRADVRDEERARH